MTYFVLKRGAGEFYAMNMTLSEEVPAIDLEREARASTLSDVLLDAYTTLSCAPLEVFGVGDRVAGETTRYVMMGALMVAIDAAIGKLPDTWEKATA